jgi:DNA-binding phage protein
MFTNLCQSSPKQYLDKIIEWWYINNMSKISKILKGTVQKEKYSLRGIAKAVGIDHASLSRSLKDDGNPESRTVEKILDYLGYDLKLIKRKRTKPNSQSRSKRVSWLNGKYQRWGC